MPNHNTIQIPHHFVPRPYQIPLYNARPAGYNRGAVVWHRRAGKDKTFLNILAREAATHVGTYFYILPYYKQARLIIWEGMDSTGFRFIDHIPAPLIAKKRDQEMTIHLKNGSILRFLGSDNIDAIVGSNPIGVLFSEYSLHKPQAWNYLRPILAENGGWAFFNFTPRGKNHAYKLFKEALNNPKWFTETLTADHTNAIKPADIEEERRNGMPPELIDQEFYCSFDAGMVGSYYQDILKTLQQADPPHFTAVPHDPNLPAGVAWDLGMNDENVLWFYQQHRNEVRLIDYYQSSGKPLAHYVNVINNTQYYPSEHILPHDVNVREYTTAKKRIDTFRSLNLRNLRVNKRVPIEEGIHAVRQLLPRCYFDSIKCADGIECLRNYRRDFDEKNNVFRKTPAHDEFSHGADGFRMLALGIREAKTKEEQNVLKHQSAIGYDHDPFARMHRTSSTLYEKHIYRELYTDPNNYDPLGRAH